MELFWDSRTLQEYCRVGGGGSLGEGLEVCSLVLLLAFALLPFLPRCEHALCHRATCHHAFLVLVDHVPSNQELEKPFLPYVTSCQALAVMSGTQQTAASPHHCHHLCQWHCLSLQGSYPSLCCSWCCFIASESHS